LVSTGKGGWILTFWRLQWAWRCSLTWVFLTFWLPWEWSSWPLRPPLTLWISLLQL
jgi:hypothetical protein